MMSQMPLERDRATTRVIPIHNRRSFTAIPWRGLFMWRDNRDEQE